MGICYYSFVKFCKGIAELDVIPEFTVATIGNFDGLHLGHREIINRVISHARRENGTAVVITFRPHPQMALAPVEDPRLINTYEEKVELLEQMGVDIVIEEPFSREFSNTSPDEFVNKYLLRDLGTKVLYLGYDFAFGKGRTGTVDTLKPLANARGIELNVVEPHLVDGKPVSSSRVREAIDAGDSQTALECLDRPFFVRGNVVRGAGRGRQIGFPTANIAMAFRKMPRQGVHVTRTIWHGHAYPSVTNVGSNPTFEPDKDNPDIETHLLDFDNDLYGDTIEVQFLDYLREEKKFSGAEELIEQIKQDCQKARDFHQTIKEKN